MTADAAGLAGIATTQRGLFTRQQARGCGYSNYQVRRRLDTNEWQVFLGPVLASAGLARTPALVDRAAWLAVPGAVLAGPSAARWHGMPVHDRRAWLAVPVSAHLRVPSVGVLRGPVSRFDVVLIDGMLVTDRARTVFDCLRVLPGPAALDLLDRALQQRWTTLDDLTGRVRASAGRRGVGRLVRLVAEAGSGARSAAERLAVDLLRRAGLDGWRANLPIHDAAGELIGVGDLVFRAERVVIELDGRAFHTTSERFERDRYRQNRLTSAGWIVLRFTWRDLTRRPGYVTSTVRRVVGDCRVGVRA
jgi:very-short-patch-repair endonuclease